MPVNYLQSDQLLRTITQFSQLGTAAHTDPDISAQITDALRALTIGFGLNYAAFYRLTEATLTRTNLSGEAARARKPLEAEIALTDANSPIAEAIRSGANVMGSVRTRAEFLLPVHAGETTFGVLFVQHPQSNFFTRELQQLMVTLAAQLGAALAASDFTRKRIDQEALERRATELELVTTVSAAIAVNLDVDDLLQTVVDLTKEAFKLYHTHVYLLNEAQGQLVLAAGAGDAGRMMLSRGHSIPLRREHSLVARAARTRQGVIVNDVWGEPDFLPNPLLPKTRSELSVPLLSGARLIGVLDVQAEQTGRFGIDDIRIQQTLADQITIALQNARLFSDLQATSFELLLRQQAIDSSQSAFTIAAVTHPDMPLIYVNPAFETITGYSIGESLGRNCRFLQNDDRDQPALTELRAALKGGESATVILRNYRKDGTLFYNELKVSPIHDSEGTLTHFVGVSNDVSGRLAFERIIQATATRAELVSEISTALSQATSEAAILTALRPLARQSGIDGFRLTYADFGANGQVASTQLIAEMIGGELRQVEPRGEWADNTQRSPMFTAFFPASDHVQYIESLATHPHFETPEFVAYCEALKAGSMVVIPLRAGDEWQGMLEAWWTMPRRIDADTRDLIESIQGALSAMVGTRRAFNAEQISLRDAETLFLSGGKINSAGSEGAMVEAMATSIIADAANGVSLSVWENLDFSKAATVRTVAEWRRDGQVVAFGKPTLISQLPLLPLFDPDTPTVFDDVAGDPRISSPNREQLLRFGVAALVFVPLRIGERWLGNMTIISGKARVHTGRELRLLRSVAEQIAPALERLVLLREAERRTRELEIVAQVSTTTATILDVTEMLTRVCDLTKQGFELYHVHIYLLNDEKTQLVLRAGAGEPGRIMRERRHAIPVARERSLVARAARDKKAVIVNDVSGADDWLPNPLLPDTRAEMAVPMIIGDTLLGVMDLQSEKINRFGASDSLIQTSLGEQVAVAVQNAVLYEHERQTSQQLREVDRLKSEFLASMSHELRTPLNSIIGYSEVLVDGIDGDLSEEAIIDVQAIHDSGHHLLGLINDILDLAKIEAGHMELDLEPVEIAEIAREVESITSVLVKDRPISLIFDIAEGLPSLLGDHLRLRQILNNLVSNSIKFTEQGEVRVSAALNEAEDQVKIMVKDTGIGIAPHHLGLIFEQFRQVDNSSTRRVGGTGLGLPITQRLVQMHGGTIVVESEVGVGSSFSFMIPVIRIGVAG